MRKHVYVFAASGFILACVAMAATAQVVTPPPGVQQQSHEHSTGQPGTGQGRMSGGMMGGGMMSGMMGSGMMGHPVMMRMIFTLMDSDGDGTVSLQEFQAAHKRIFKAMDANKDGRRVHRLIKLVLGTPRMQCARCRHWRAAICSDCRPTMKWYVYRRTASKS